jgi:Zn-dependent peptidase ImmA (M78 family)
MAGTVKISGEVLQWARNSIGYSLDEAASKASISAHTLDAWERGEKSPTYKQLETLAERVFKRSIALLLMQTIPREEPIQQDFRNITNSDRSRLSSEMLLVLRRTKRYQRILEEVNRNTSRARILGFKVSIDDDPLAAAVRLRDYIGLTIEEQKSWNAERGYYEFKRIIEQAGIYIFQLKMPFREARAFCLTGDFPVIVLNSDDAINGRIFSLFHEVCHILFNVNGIFRDAATGALSKEYKQIEQFCNEFAAAFLVPDKEFNRDIIHLNIDASRADLFIAKLARSYNVSNEVIARKFLSKQLLTESKFWRLKNLWDAAASNAKEQRNQKMKEREITGIAQDVKILSEKGRPYVQDVVSAFKEGTISSSDLLNYLETKSNHVNAIITKLSS